MPRREIKLSAQLFPAVRAESPLEVLFAAVWAEIRWMEGPIYLLGPFRTPLLILFHLVFLLRGEPDVPILWPPDELGHCIHQKNDRDGDHRQDDDVRRQSHDIAYDISQMNCRHLSENILLDMFLERSNGYSGRPVGDANGL